MDHILSVEQSQRWATNDPTLVDEVQQYLADHLVLAANVYTADGELAWVDWSQRAEVGWWKRFRNREVQHV